MKKFFYQSSPQHILRDISADKQITNMTLSVKDGNNDLFNFNKDHSGFKLI